MQLDEVSFSNLRDYCSNGVRPFAAHYDSKQRSNSVATTRKLIATAGLFFRTMV